jgi:hypothetical protein
VYELDTLGAHVLGVVVFHFQGVVLAALGRRDFVRHSDAALFGGLPCWGWQG